MLSNEELKIIYYNVNDNDIENIMEFIINIKTLYVDFRLKNIKEISVNYNVIPCKYNYMYKFIHDDGR
jgi:hypothetical protein